MFKLSNSKNYNLKINKLLLTLSKPNTNSFEEFLVMKVPESGITNQLNAKVQF